MVYGSATFMGIPWDTIIKMYRKNELGDICYDRLQDYADNFLEFLGGCKVNIPENIQKKYLVDDIYSCFSRVIDLGLSDIYDILREQDELDDATAIEIMSNTIKFQYTLWKEAKISPTLDEEFENRLLEEYDKLISKCINNVFKKYPLSQTCLGYLKKLAIFNLTRFSDEETRDNESGIVIAGFGEDEMFPSVVSYHIGRIVNDKLMYALEKQQHKNFGTGGSIFAFAQHEMVELFMEGVDPVYREIKDDYVRELIIQYPITIIDTMKHLTDSDRNELKKRFAESSEEVLNHLQEYLDAYRERHHINPIIRMIRVLPKDQLAEMAESLVNLTSLKRKYTPESETVGGPVDVALISKGDGFIWIKRKRYFNIDMNPHFRENYYRGCEKNDEI